MPKIIPIAAGIKARRPMDWLCSIAGIIKDQTLAADITPEAKPKRLFCRRPLKLSFKKKTQAEPSAVPKNGSVNKINSWEETLIKQNYKSDSFLCKGGFAKTGCCKSREMRYNGKMAEKERTTFERLVSQISEDERSALLEKMRPLEGDPDSRALESEKDPAMDADGIVIEESLKRESFFYRLILWLRSLLTSTPAEQLYNDDKIMALFRKINRDYPGLIDYKGALLLGIFYEKLLELKKAADFFRPYLDSIYKNIGAFYVFLGASVVPEVAKRMNDEIDPMRLPLDREVTGELRSSFLRKMEDVIKEIPSPKRAYMYQCAASVDWLYQFTRLPFERFAGAFSNGLSDSQVARFESVSSELNAFAKILCNGKSLPTEAFESVFLFSAKEMVPASSEAKDDDSRAKEFMDKATSFMTIIHMFINSVPLRYVNKVVYNNIQWQPEQFSGAEDWFARYKEQWKRLFDEQWNYWLKEKKKNSLNKRLKDNFGIEKVPLLPDRPWAEMWGGVNFHYENTAGFLYWFVSKKQNEVCEPLKTLLLEGQFVNKENRAEFANTLNDLSQISSAIYDLAEDLSKSGQTGMVFEKLASDHLRTLAAQSKIDTLIIEREALVKANKNSFCNCARSVLSVLGGVFSEKKDTRYDGIQNLASIQGSQNAAFRGSLMQSQKVFAAALDILKELEQIDMPPAGSK